MDKSVCAFLLSRKTQICVWLVMRRRGRCGWTTRLSPLRSRVRFVVGSSRLCSNPVLMWQQYKSTLYASIESCRFTVGALALKGNWEGECSYLQFGPVNFTNIRIFTPPLPPTKALVQSSSIEILNLPSWKFTPLPDESHMMGQIQNFAKIKFAKVKSINLHMKSGQYEVKTYEIRAIWHQHQWCCGHHSWLSSWEARVQALIGPLLKVFNWDN